MVSFLEFFHKTINTPTQPTITFAQNSLSVLIINKVHKIVIALNEKEEHI